MLLLLFMLGHALHLNFFMLIAQSIYFIIIPSLSVANIFHAHPYCSFPLSTKQSTYPNLGKVLPEVRIITCGFSHNLDTTI